MRSNYGHYKYEQDLGTVSHSSDHASKSKRMKLMQDPAYLKFLPPSGVSAPYIHSLCHYPLVAFSNPNEASSITKACKPTVFTFERLQRLQSNSFPSVKGSSSLANCRPT